MLHLGCGNLILEEFLNVDRAKLTGVDIVHDLAKRPWPFPSKQFEEVIMVDVLEHLPAIVPALEEVYRITRPGGRVVLRVPYYNAWDAWSDPTHLHAFNESSFDLLDPARMLGKTRPYCTRARFSIVLIGYLVHWAGISRLLIRHDAAIPRPSLPEAYRLPVVRSSILYRLYTHGAHKIGNLIRALHVELIRL